MKPAGRFFTLRFCDMAGEQMAFFWIIHKSARSRAEVGQASARSLPGIGQNQLASTVAPLPLDCHLVYGKGSAKGERRVAKFAEPAPDERPQRLAAKARVSRKWRMAVFCVFILASV